VISNEIDRLFSVYAAERQDDQNALTVAFAIATAGLTYVIAVTAYLSDHCGPRGCGKLPQVVQLLSPLVAVIFVGFMVLNVAATRMRSVHLQRLEAKLKIPLGDGKAAPQFHTDSGLVFRPERLTQKPHVRLLFAVITFIAYGSVMVILMSFTYTALVRGPWTAPKKACAIAYGVIESVELAGFVAPLKHERFVYEGPAEL